MECPRGYELHVFDRLLELCRCFRQRGVCILASFASVAFKNTIIELLTAIKNTFLASSAVL